MGASVFYSKPPSNCEASHDAEANNPVEQLEKDIEVNQIISIKSFLLKWFLSFIYNYFVK